MRRNYNIFSIGRAHKAAKYFLLPLILTALISFSGATSGANAQSTAEVCRKTKEAYEQYLREKDDLVLLITIQGNEAKWRTRLSELRRGIAGGFVISNLEFFKILNLPEPGSSTKDRLAFQKTVRDVLERTIQKARDTNPDDLNSQYDRVIEQLQVREQRMKDLSCDEVLAREESSSNDAGEKKSSNGCVGFAGKWLTSIENVVLVLNAGGSGSYFWRNQNNTISGSVSGKVLEGEYQQPWHSNDNLKSGRVKFTLSSDGNSFTGQWWYKNGTLGGSWNGTCQSGN